jgi:hypothetical protein
MFQGRWYIAALVGVWVLLFICDWCLKKGQPCGTELLLTCGVYANFRWYQNWIVEYPFNVGEMVLEQTTWCQRKKSFQFSQQLASICESCEWDILEIKSAYPVKLSVHCRLSWHLTGTTRKLTSWQLLRFLIHRIIILFFFASMGVWAQGLVLRKRKRERERER